MARREALKKHWSPGPGGRRERAPPLLSLGPTLTTRPRVAAKVHAPVFVQAAERLSGAGSSAPSGCGLHIEGPHSSLADSPPTKSEHPKSIALTDGDKAPERFACWPVWTKNG
mmetsp:Transcript_178244/g.571376  ORF Transcript_178244/g.571376 Transcript_178244/m.571376 type:complete len:113 (-) Transcript_178244:23-361(-)